MNATVGKQIRASDVDLRIISLQIFRNQTIQIKKVHWNMKKPQTCAYISTKIDKISEKYTDESVSQNIHVYMARMSTNTESTRRSYGDIFQLTNWILDSGATCHITLDISNFIPVSLVETDKYIEVADEHFVTAKQTG